MNIFSKTKTEAFSHYRRDDFSLIATVWIFIFLVCLSLTSFQVWRAANTHDMTMDYAETVNANLANALAKQADETLQMTDNTLAVLVERIETSEGKSTQNDLLHSQLVSTVANMNELYGLKVYGANGRQIANSQPMLDTKDDASQNENFLFHQGNYAQRYYLSKPMRERNGSSWVLQMSRRINTPDGRFAGIVLASIDADYFRRFYDSFDIEQEEEMSLSTLDGYVFFRRPSLPDLSGAYIGGTKLFTQHIAKHNSGNARLTSDNSGVMKLLSYQQLQHYPMVVVVGADEDELLAGWRTENIVQSIISFILIVGAAVAGNHLTRQIKIRVATENKLRKIQFRLKNLNRSLAGLAMQDGLTGLSNRRAFDQLLEREYSRAARNKTSLAMIMIDIDYFKQFNDKYGHLMGDECLKAVAKAAVTAQHRATDMTARYGGEEIAILLPETDMPGAVLIAEKVLQEIRNLRMPHEGSPKQYVTVSAGVHVSWPTVDDTQPQDLIYVADKALYVSKHRGRDRVTSSKIVPMMMIDELNAG